MSGRLFLNPRLLLLLLLLLPGGAAPELIILGAGDMGGGKFWVELYATTDIPDPGEYTLQTKQNYTLPGDGIAAGEHVIASDDRLTDRLNDFIEVPVDHLYFTNKVSLDHGDDPIYLLHGLQKVDAYGEGRAGDPGDGFDTNWAYKFGYIRRKDAVPPSGTTFDVNDWIIVTSEPLLKNCIVNSDCGANAYPFKDYEPEKTATETTTTELPITEPTTSEPTATEVHVGLQTTDLPTTEPTESDPTATELPTSEPTATELPTSEPTTAELPTTEPTTTELHTSTTELPTSKLLTAELPTTEPTTTEPTTTEVHVGLRTTYLPTTEPTASEMPTTEPTTTEVHVGLPTTEPTASEMPTTAPTTTELYVGLPTTDLPTTEPTTTEVHVGLPTTDLPATEPTASEMPTTEPTTTDLETTDLMTPEPPKTPTTELATEYTSPTPRPSSKPPKTTVSPVLKRPTPLRHAVTRPRPKEGPSEAHMAQGIGYTWCFLVLIFIACIIALDIDKLYLHIKMGIGNLTWCFRRR